MTTVTMTTVLNILVLVAFAALFMSMFTGVLCFCWLLKSLFSKKQPPAPVPTSAQPILQGLLDEAEREQQARVSQVRRDNLVDGLLNTVLNSAVNSVVP